MGSQLRQWAVRLLAAVALPIMLTLGVGVAANAQPVQASHVTSSTRLPSVHRNWEVFGPYDSLYVCKRVQREFRGDASFCKAVDRPRRMERVWYLYVYMRHGRM